jgi:hypothetical protein
MPDQRPTSASIEMEAPKQHLGGSSGSGGSEEHQHEQVGGVVCFIKFYHRFAYTNFLLYKD